MQQYTYLELHGRELVHDITHGITNLGPGDLVVASFNHVGGMLVEADHVTKHPSGLVEGAVTIVVAVTVLLQKVILDKSGNIQGNLVRFIQTRLCMWIIK